MKRQYGNITKAYIFWYYGNKHRYTLYTIIVVLWIVILGAWSQIREAEIKYHLVAYQHACQVDAIWLERMLNEEKKNSQ